MTTKQALDILNDETQAYTLTEAKAAAKALVKAYIDLKVEYDYAEHLRLKALDKVATTK